MSEWRYCRHCGQKLQPSGNGYWIHNWNFIRNCLEPSGDYAKTLAEAIPLYCLVVTEEVPV